MKTVRVSARIRGRLAEWYDDLEYKSHHVREALRDYKRKLEDEE